ncbi:MAG: GntR family transcriptional regulator [Proteobacteria bacterium]|nr:GntR family transcriptional regulator [Pseudomonadota bacterium]
MTTSVLINLFSLNVSSGIPIYRQLIDQIKQAIRMGLLNSHEQLPSVRVLAKALQINPMTISKAFTQLEIEGVLIRKRGVGMLVAEVKQNNTISKKTETALTQFIQFAKSDDLSDDEISTLVQQYLSLKSKEKHK